MEEDKPQELDRASDPEELGQDEIAGTRVVGRMMSMMASVGNPLLQKLESKHIDRALDLSENQSARERTSEKEARWLLLLGGVILLCFLAFLIIRLESNSDLLLQIIYPLISFIVGLVGGYGFGRQR